MKQETFIEELKKIKIFPTKEQIKQLEEYYTLIVEYNKVMNLTGIIEKEESYLKHFYDSLTLNKIIDLTTINTMCDVGSGAGLPGLVIKIFFPHIQITLLDSLNKRIHFLNIVIEKLNLKNIETIHDRAEEFSVKNINKYDLVTARAVAKTNILLEMTIQMININGFFVAMKGNSQTEGIISNEVEKKLNCKLIEKIEFQLPNENSERTLLKFQKTNHTNLKYPRKFEQIKKKPL